MGNLSIKEELQILNAAKLAGTEAPEKLNTKEAREFVRAQMSSKKSKRNIFSQPVTYFAFAMAACLVAVLFVFRPDEGASLELNQQDQIHAVADSVETVNDSTKLSAGEDLEISVVDE